MTNPIETAEKLLERTLVVKKCLENQYRETGEAYNVFKSARIHNDERKMCNVLADWLDPKGRHYRGSAYLNLFMEEVVRQRLKMDVALDPSKTEILREYRTDEDRYIDIVITDGKVFIPIEAKIGSPDSEKQLDDYAAFSKKMNPDGRFIPVLFLTRDGHSPSKEVSSEHYVCISFENDILSWLEKCLEHEETKKAPPVSEVLKQYIKAIELFCGHKEDEKMAKEMMEIIMKSKDIYEAALLISKTVEEAKAKEFEPKVLEIFKNKICDLVKKKIHDTESKYRDEYEDNRLYSWHYLEINIGNGYKLWVHFDVRSFKVEYTKSEEEAIAEKTEKIKTIMSEKTGEHDDGSEKHAIWVSNKVIFSGFKDFEGIDNLDMYLGMYMYKLYHTYSNEPESVVDWIVSIAKALMEICR